MDKNYLDLNELAERSLKAGLNYLDLLAREKYLYQKCSTKAVSYKNKRDRLIFFICLY